MQHHILSQFILQWNKTWRDTHLQSSNDTLVSKNRELKSGPLNNVLQLRAIKTFKFGITVIWYCLCTLVYTLHTVLIEQILISALLHLESMKELGSTCLGVRLASVPLFPFYLAWKKRGVRANLYCPQWWKKTEIKKKNSYQINLLERIIWGYTINWSESQGIYSFLYLYKKDF